MTRVTMRGITVSCGVVSVLLLVCIFQLCVARVSDDPPTGRGASRTLKGADTEITGLRLEDIVTEMNSM